MKTVEEIKALAEKRYGIDPNSFGGQRDGFKEGFKQAQEMQLLQSCVVGQSEQLTCECGKLPDEKYDPCCSIECWHEMFT